MKNIKLYIVFLIGLVSGSFVFGLTVNKTIQDLSAFIQSINFTTDGTPTGQTTVKIDGTGIGSIYSSGDIRIGKGNGNTIFTKTSSHYVGINTNNPQYSLDVNNNLRVWGNSLVGGKIRIGTEDVTSNNAKLQVTDNTNNAEIIIHSDRNGNGHWGIYQDGNENKFKIWGGGNDRLTITNDGNVGIGTSNPGYKLGVQGDIASTGWLKTYGNNGWYSETYGGGWYMEDTSWMRVYGNKSIYTAGGLYTNGFIRSNSSICDGYGYCLNTRTKSSQAHHNIDVGTLSNYHGGCSYMHMNTQDCNAACNRWCSWENPGSIGGTSVEMDGTKGECICFY